MKKYSLISYFTAICLILLLSTEIFAADYFVDKKTGSDSYAGTSKCTPWKTMSKVNASLFSPGDTIHFKRGQTWWGELIISSSGSPGNPITYKQYGTSGFASITPATGVKGPASAWVNMGNHIWQRPLVSQSWLVIYNGSTLGRWSTTPSADFDFYWENGYLFVYAKRNPSSYYNGMVATTGLNGISLNGQNNIVIEDFKVFGGQLGIDGSTGPGGGIYIDQNANNVTIKNVTIKECYGGGIRVRGADNIIIKGCDISNITNHIGIIPGGNSGDGIEINWELSTKKSSQNITISDNTFHGFIDRNSISILSGTDVIIEKNTVLATGSLCGIDLEPNVDSDQIIQNIRISENNIDITGDFHHKPDGISAFAHNMDQIDILWNRVRIHGGTDGPRFGILIANSNNTTQLTRTTIMGNHIEGAEDGIRIGARIDAVVTRNFIRSKTGGFTGMRVVGGGKGVFSYNIVSGFETSAGIMDLGSHMDLYNNTFFRYEFFAMEARDFPLTLIAKNNICYTNATNTLARHMKKQSSANVTLNYNSYYPQNRAFIWDGVDKSLAELKVSPYLQEKNGVIADPLFQNGSGQFTEVEDFYLNETSPLIDKGVLLNFNEDYDGKIVPVNSAVDMGAYEQAAGVIASYLMNEKSGTRISDLSGNSNHGKMKNGATLASGSYPNGGVEFFGGTSVVRAPDSPSMDVDRITLSAFVNQNTRSRGARIIDRGYYALYVKSVGKATFALRIGASYHYLTSKTTVPLNLWTHIAGSYDETAMKLFINGKLVGEKVVNGKIKHNNYKLNIGNRDNLNRGFVGVIDDVLILDQAISQTDLNELVNQ